MIPSHKAVIFFMASNIIFRSAAFTINSSRLVTIHSKRNNIVRQSNYHFRSISSKIRSTTEDQIESDSTLSNNAYPFKEVEKKWQDFWDKNQTFKTPERSKGKEKKYVLDMFPYPSGAGLHVGHPEGYTASDAMARYWRMKGYDVLHPMGWDSFGLPAEQYAINTGAQPAETTALNIATFKRQLKSLGFSYDWDREIATTDIDYVKWTQWIFLQLYKKGLAEQSSMSVNWCPALGTVLANEEIINGLSERGNHPVERFPLRQWVLKITDYADRLEQGLEGLDWPSGTMTSQQQWIGKSTGCNADFDVFGLDGEKITVFTTRPDTLMGVTYVTLAPEHPLVQKITTDDRKEEVEKYVAQTSSRSDLDRTASKEKTGVFTGGYAVHPISKEKVPVWVGDYVLGSYGTGAVMAVPAHDERDLEFAKKYGLPIVNVVKPVKENVKIDENEAFTADGITFNSGEFDGLTTVKAKEAIASKLKELNKGGPKITYKLRDWCFSRQRYWGEPIPIYFPVIFPEGVTAEEANPRDEDCEHTIDFDNPIPVDESELPLRLPIMEDFKPGNDPAGCLARAKEWRYFQKDGKWFARETNTMPQWAGSCWYYLRFTDPKNPSAAFSSKADEDWMPVDLYIGGAEHAVLHLLYARFWHQVLYDLGFTKHPEPFKKLVHQGMILGADGEKMSKSRGNVVNPDDVVSSQGADALRLYEMFMGPLEAVKPWQTSQVSGVVRFQNKLYNVVKTAAANNVNEMDDETTKILHKTMKKVTEDIENMSFNTAISAMMVLTNHLQSLKEKVPREAAEKLAIMVSPFAPHLGEECRSMLGFDGSLAYEPWVEYDDALCVDNTIKMGVQVNGKVRGEIEILKDADQETAMEEAMKQSRVEAQLEGKEIKKIIFVPGRILNIVANKLLSFTIILYEWEVTRDQFIIMTFQSELLEAVVKIIENDCDEKTVNVTKNDILSLMSMITRLKERLETMDNEQKSHEVGSTSFSTPKETPTYLTQNSPNRIDEDKGIKKVKILSNDFKNDEDELDESTSDSIDSHQVHRRLSQPSLQQIKENDRANNEESNEAYCKDIFFNRFKRKGGRSSSIYPQQARIIMHSRQSPPGLSDEFPPNSDNWKQAAIDAFRLIDDNGDGFLQKEEVIAAIKTMEENGMTIIDSSNLSPEEIAESMMKDVDTDGDGLIDIDEFVEMMKRNVTSEASGNTNSFISYNHRMSQLARNVLLAHQKKIENSIIGKDLWMIHPYSNFHVSWDIMVSLLIVLTVITMPLSIGWEELNREFFGLNLTVDLIFLLDIIKNFFTGIVDENDTVIMDHRIVRRQYLMGFFIVDFCSSIPLDLIFRLAGADDVVSTGGAVTGTKNSLRMLRLLRMAKLLRLFRVSRLANHVRNFFIWIEETLKIHISDGFTKMIRLMVGALVLGHWIGCFNFMLVRLYDFPEDSWVVYAGLHDKDPYTQWNWSFFKALAQMIMIGFETPPFTNASCDTTSHWCGIEHWITLGCLYIGAVFYSLLISSISSIIQTASLASRHFEEKLTQIDDYMRSKKLPASMREKVKDSFHLQHSNGKMFNENEILDMLSPILRREIKLFTGRDLTAKVPLLSMITNKSFAEEMSAAIDPFISFPNEVIIRENTMGHEMYFISSGVVEIFLPGSKSASYVAIGDGCFFGEVSLLLNTKRTASARTKTQCMLFKISKDRLLTVLKDFPDMLETMIKVAESRRRRLMHYKNPGKYSLAKEDEIDSEDRKTELFGAEEERVVQEKDKEMMRVRNRSRHAGIKSGGLLLQRRH